MNFSEINSPEPCMLGAVKESREQQFARDIKEVLFNDYEIENINTFLYHLKDLVKKELENRAMLLNEEMLRHKNVLDNI